MMSQRKTSRGIGGPLLRVKQAVPARELTDTVDPQLP
jgi:hypothetical protein